MERVVVITGGTSGIGEATAKYFAKHGDTVVVMSRKNSNHSKNFFMCDVSNELMVERTFEKIYATYGRIDILVNNAGYGISGAVELIDDETMRNLFEVNYYGVVYCSKYCLPYMQKGAKILNISSACALFPLPFRSLYCASKAAVNMLSYSMRLECRPAGIEIMAICPGDVKTNFTKNRVKVFETNDRYNDRIKNAALTIDTREHKRMSPDKVAKVIYKQSLKKKNKPFVIVSGLYKFLYFLTKIFPLSMTHGVILKMFGGFKPVKNEDQYKHKEIVK